MAHLKGGKAAQSHFGSSNLTGNSYKTVGEVVVNEVGAFAAGSACFPEVCDSESDGSSSIESQEGDDPWPSFVWSEPFPQNHSSKLNSFPSSSSCSSESSSSAKVYSPAEAESC